MSYNENYKYEEHWIVDEIYQFLLAVHLYTWEYTKIFLRNGLERIDLKDMQIFNED